MGPGPSRGFVDHGGVQILRLELTGHERIENRLQIWNCRFARHIALLLTQGKVRNETSTCIVVVILDPRLSAVPCDLETWQPA